MEHEHSFAGAATLVPPRAWPDVDHVITEDDTPVDGAFSTHQMRLLVSPLAHSWQGPTWDPRFHCDANVGVFESVNLPPIVPDFFLVLGVTWPQPIGLKQNRSFFIEGIGKPPDLVVEIVSNTKGGEDSKKLADYAGLKVRYYLIHDPDRLLSNEVLRAYELVDGEFQRLNGTWLAGVELGFVLWPGSWEGLTDVWLRWVDRDGRLIPNEDERVAAERAKREAAELQSAQDRAVREAAELQSAQDRSEREAAELQAAQDRSEREAADLLAAQERLEREAAERRVAELEARLREMEPRDSP